MKFKLLFISFLIFGISACTYKTCPTYAKKDMKKEIEEVKKANV